MRLGAIGAGQIFQRYERAAAEIGTCSIIAVLEPNPLRRQNAARHGRQLHSKLSAFLDEPLDAVLVLTPNGLHRAIVEACLDRGLPTLCEKPLATNAADAAAMFAHATARGTLLFAAMHSRYRPEVRYLGDHLDGAITEFEQVWLEDWRSGAPWYFNAGVSGGGVLLDAGINHIDWIGSHIAGLGVRDASAVVVGEVDHDFSVSWTFPGGTGSTRLSWRGSPELRRSRVVSSTGTTFDLLHDDCAVFHNGRRCGPWPNDEYTDVLRHFLREIADPAAREPSNAVEVLSLIARVYERAGLPFAGATVS